MIEIKKIIMMQAFFTTADGFKLRIYNEKFTQNSNPGNSNA